MIGPANLSDEAFRALVSPYTLGQGQDDGRNEPNRFEFHLGYSTSNLDLIKAENYNNYIIIH